MIGKRLLSLTSTLKNQEITTLTFVIKSHRNKKLYKLWEYTQNCLQNNGLFDPKTAFPQVFNLPYSSKKDYLIRNEIRLLMQLIRDHVAQNVLLEKSHQNQKDTFYLEGLLQREALELFELESARIRRKAEKDENHEQLLAINHLYARYIPFFKLSKENEFRHLRDLASTTLPHLKTEALIRELETVNTGAFANRNLTAMLADDAIGDFALPDMQHANDYAWYLWHKIQAYQKEGKARIPHIEKALEHLQTATSPRLQTAIEKTTMISNLAIEKYLFDQKFEEAAALYEQVLSDLESTPPSHQAKLLINYLSVVLKSGQYKKGYGIIQNHRPLLSKYHYTRTRINILELMTLLNLGKWKAALPFINSTLKSGSRENYYYQRFCLIIIYYQKGDLEMALREAVNMMQLLRKETAFEVYLIATDIFRKFILWKTDHEAPENLIPLAEEMHAFLQSNIIDNTAIMPFEWLMREMDEESLSTKN